jgi:sec-independent protein translocase protein TatC
MAEESNATPGLGEATADAATADAPTAEPDYPRPEEENDGGLFGEGPDSDQEMPLTEHIEEMVRRVAVVVGVAMVITLAVFPVADSAITFLWNTHIPDLAAQDTRPRLYAPLELILTEVKVASLAGVVVGLPVFVYETYLFMRPGLYPKERKYYLAAVPTSLILALVGVAFAHFIILPAIFAYFTSYTTGTAIIAFGLKETFNLILILMGYMAIVFQIPLFIMLAIMMNLVTRIWLEDKRLLFWGAFLGLAFLVSPDPTGMSPILVAATMVGLFEGTLALLRWTGN